MRMEKIDKIRKPDHLLSLFRNQISGMVILALTGLLYNFGMIANPVFQGKLVDMIEKKAFVEDIGILYQLLFLYLFFIVLTQVSRAIKRYLTRSFSFKACTSLRLMVYNNILNQNAKELEESKIGTLISRATSDIDKTVEGLRKILTETLDTFVFFFVYMVYLFLFDPKMTSLVLLPLAVGVFFSFVLRKKNFQYSSKARKTNARLSSKTFDLMDNALLYRIYGRDISNQEEYSEYLKEYEKDNGKSLIIADILKPLTTLISLTGLLPLICFSAVNVISSKSLAFPFVGFGETKWTIGIFTTYLSTFVILANKAGYTAKLFSAFENGLASWKRIKPYMKDYHDYDIGRKSEGNDMVLSFHDYSLSIDSRTLISNLDLSLHEGEILGVTGMISSGKSAFLKSLIKEIPYQGSVLLCGKEIKDMPLCDVSADITYMGHRPELFTDTVKNNVSLGDDKDVNRYLSLVSFDEDLKSMKDKENSIVGNEGVKLSGGQKQRIALARSIYHKKNVLLLDDPFSSVDEKTEMEILSSLNQIRKDTIVILVSHRLEAFPYLDQILVLHGDSSFDIGTHEELLKRSETYRTLYEIQSFGKEKEDEE